MVRVVIMRYLIDFSYSGELFSGYQKQPGLRTIQEELEKVLTSINNSPVVICASGRTDAKVNALHQKAHFDLNANLPCYKLKGALNSYLPDDIHVNEVTIVSDSFHARYMVKSKTYQYRINIGSYNPILRSHVYQYCKPLNVALMKTAIKDFEGILDFTSFSSAQDKRTNKIREVFEAKLDQIDDTIIITFKGKGFLKYQVRSMVGTLIKIGEEKIAPNSIPNLINKKNRKSAPFMAPANGLTLTSVEY